MGELVKGTGIPGMIVTDVPMLQYERKDDGYFEFKKDSSGDGAGYSDNCMNFMKCYKCGLVKIEYQESNYRYCPICKSPWDEEHLTILNAILKAKQARF